MVQQVRYLITAATGATGSATIAIVQINGQQDICASVHHKDERTNHVTERHIKSKQGWFSDKI
jgi:NADPH-dependent curcumin reductase CurA